MAITHGVVENVMVRSYFWKENVKRNVGIILKCVLSILHVRWEGAMCILIC
jgi:hypothetical protein